MDLTPRMTESAMVARSAAAGSMVLLKNVRHTLTLLAVDAGRKLLHLASKPTFANLDAWVNAMLEQE